MKRKISIKSRLFVSLLTGVLLLCSAEHGYSKTIAYLFSKEEMITMDTGTDTIMKRIKSDDGLEGFYGEFKKAGCVVDIVNGTLMILADKGFNVYDVKTFKYIKTVPYPSIVNQPDKGKIIYPQKGTKFFIELMDDDLKKSGQRGLVNLSFDKKTYDYLGTTENVLSYIREKFWISEDQNTIYVDTDESNLRIYDAQEMKYLKLTDLSNIYEHPTRRDIDDIRNGVALLTENNKLLDTDKSNYSFLTYNISDSTKTPRVRLPEIGFINEALLISNSSKVVFNDVHYAPTTLPSPPKGTISSTVLHVYGINSGSKLGLISFDSNFRGQILGIRPQGDRLYYFMFSKDESKMRLAVVDLTAYKVIKEIPVPNLYFMVFFEEAESSGGSGTVQP